MITPDYIEIKKSGFDFEGGMLSFDVPEGCNLIILCGNSGGGMQPFKCLLPHQVYKTNLLKIFEETGYEVITVIPVNSDVAFPIAYKNKYSQQRWKGMGMEKSHE